MKKIIQTSLIAAAACGLAATPSSAEETATPEAMTEGEAKLAKMLEGRVAGDPQSCIRTFAVRDFDIIDETALVYRIGRTLYVNVPRNAASLDDDDGIRTRTHGTRLCRTDIVTTFDRHHQFYTGNVQLGQFVPYRLADS